MLFFLIILKLFVIIIILVNGLRCLRREHCLETRQVAKETAKQQADKLIINSCVDADSVAVNDLDSLV